MTLEDGAGRAKGRDSSTGVKRSASHLALWRGIRQGRHRGPAGAGGPVWHPFDPARTLV